MTTTDVVSVIQAAAEILRAIVWPGLVLLLSVRYRAEVGRLIDRLRRGGPAEFDPLPPSQSQGSGALPAVAAVGHAEVEALRTPAVREIEVKIRALDPIAGDPDPARREATMLVIAAKAVQFAAFERAEGSIYASQVEFLNYLNAAVNGETIERLKILFFDPATTRYPDIYRNYGFDAYLGYLTGAELVRVADARAFITQAGSEYLVWRVQQKKAPRLLG